MSRAFGEFFSNSFLFNDCGIFFHAALGQGVGKGMGLDIQDNSIPQISPEYYAQLTSFFRHMMAASAVDSFNTFLSTLLFEIVEKDHRPISGRNFPVKEIMQFDDIGDLKRRIIEKYIIDLGYQNIEDLVDVLEKNFGLFSISRKLTKLRLSRLIQIRNVITHNRGIVNKTYLYKSGSKRDKEGASVWVRHPVRTAQYLASLAADLDREATSKFGLMQSSYPSPRGFSDHPRDE